MVNEWKGKERPTRLLPKARDASRALPPPHPVSVGLGPATRGGRVFRWPASALSCLHLSATPFCSFCDPVLPFAQLLQCVWPPPAAILHGRSDARSMPVSSHNRLHTKSTNVHRFLVKSSSRYTLVRIFLALSSKSAPNASVNFLACLNANRDLSAVSCTFCRQFCQIETCNRGNTDPPVKTQGQNVFTREFTCSRTLSLPNHLMIEVSLEVNLPTIWTDEKAEVGRVREEKGRRQRRERVRRKKMQVREMVENRKTLCFSNVLGLRRVQ